MASSWTKFVSRCKSRSSAIARSCFLSRQRWYEKYKEAKDLLDASQEKGAALQTAHERLEAEIANLRERIAELETEMAQPKVAEWPLGEVPPGQQFGAGMITLCVNLAREGGLTSQMQFSSWCCSKKTSFGVRNPRHSRGRPLRSVSTSLTSL